MKQKQVFAAMAALLLSGLLIGCGGAKPAAEPPAAQTAAVETLAAQIAADIAAQAPKPPPIVSANTVEPTADGGDQPVMPTAMPTAVPTEEPPTEVPTETPLPTAVPPPPAPPVVQPPPPPPPPPTAVPVPPTAVPQVGANGLVASNFGVQPRAELFVNGDVWFEFHVANSTGSPVPFDALGVMPKKDGVDRPEWYQHSWGGNNDVIPAGGLSWDDHINLPEAGNYTLRLVVCFDGPACQAQRGTWHTLSSEVPVTIVQR